MSANYNDQNENDNKSANIIDIDIATIDTHGIGDSCNEKTINTCSSPYNLSDSSFASCESCKAIAKAWKMREKNSSNMIVKNRTDEFDATVEQLTLQLDRNTNSNSEECKELAKCLSLCVVLESRSLNLTESSDEDIPSIASSCKDRFFEPEEIRRAHAAFKQAEEENENFIALSKLKLALEKLSVPQTHLETKGLMNEIIGERVTKITFCQFLLIYSAILQNRNSETRKLSNSQRQIETPTESIDVSKVGVSAARRFFEAKIAEQIAEKNP